MARPKKSSDGAAAEARPFLKWAGGKSQLVDELTRRAPERFGTYHEPFLGAGALFFRLKALGRVKKARLTDINPELMNAWLALRDAPENVVAELERLQERTSEKDFYEIRALDPARLTGPERAARMIYLNKTCFNGLYRENRSGRFNVPFGRYEWPRVLDRENLLAASRALQSGRIELEQSPFSSVLRHAKEGDFVYLDPPYHPLSQTSSFTAYSRGGFGEEGQRQLAQVFAQLAEGGVHVLLSNSSAPLIHELYEGKPGFTFELVRAQRAINSKGSLRGKVDEALVSAGGPRDGRADEAPAGSQLTIAAMRGAGVPACSNR